MKRHISILITLIIVVAAATSASAQFRWGASVGADVTNLHFKQNLFTIDQAVGYSGGIVGEVIFPGVGIGIDTGLLYTQRGAVLHLGEREMWASQGYDINRSYLHYLDLPLHLRFKYTNLGGLEEDIAPLVYAGADFGFLLGHNKLEALEYTGGQIGLTVGGGVELARHWQVTVSHTWGVTYALKMAILTNDSAQNRTWNLRVAYMF